ncbi:MAG: preprotein translocase subunit SecA [Candidatus Omnitrophota bacterium]|nr:preprotein translocase subunit SecA [Candidatus Omnitrophota bacterium]
MIDFLGRNLVWKLAQNHIDKLSPSVNILLPQELPLPSMNMIKNMADTVSKINILEDSVSKLSKSEFLEKTERFKEQIKHTIQNEAAQIQHLEEQYNNAASLEDKEQINLEIKQCQTNLNTTLENSLDEILPEAFALVREAGKRTINMRHFDVQLIGGIVLHKNKIAEMATGEGKTLVATLAAYLNALTGRGVHIVTVNDYLARRDREWMGPIFEYLGLSVGVIQHEIDANARKHAYNCDITYGTNNEFGFDYLRDNMVIYKEEMVQRNLNFAIVDEVDSILIDEARTPLIISGPAEESTEKYYKAEGIARQLKGRRITEKDEIAAKYKGEDLTKGFEYIADEKAQTISLTENGEIRAAKLFGIENLHELETMEYRHHVIQSLRAKEFFKLDVDYVIKDGEVIIVDEFTGRMMPGRRWSDGLHQAVEAKEGLKIERENQTLATITFQNYFRMYNKLSGMTGTAFTEANEFKEIYKLDCLVIPTNKKLIRTNYPDCIYKTEKEKFNAVVEEIVDLYNKGRPMLVGTISIDKSEYLSGLLKRRGITHQVLNAKYHEMEAQIVAQAGRYKAVTIATNMAGRGTDILLGGNPEFMAKSFLKQTSENLSVEQLIAEHEKLKEKFRKQVEDEHKKVVELGGLHIIGTERHEARRIDNQLRGRSGRQGDPGSSRFYVSLADDLMRLFGSERIVGIMDRLGMEEGQVIEHPLVSRAIEIAQKRVETYNFEIRKQLLEYDNVMNKQREVIYSLRRSILEGKNIHNFVQLAIEESIDNGVERYFTTEAGTDIDFEGFILFLKSKFNFDLNIPMEELRVFLRNDLRELLLKKAGEYYQAKQTAIGVENSTQLERIVSLQVIDTKWKDHLYAMDSLKEGINLRAYGQRDPLIEYQHEAFSMFEEMYNSINEDVVETLFKIQAAKQERVKSVFASLPQEFVHSEFSSLSRKAQAQDMPVLAKHEPSSAAFRKETPKVGRNDPCPCGKTDANGKPIKYKKCCGR